MNPSSTASPHTSPYRKVSVGTWADRKVMALSPLQPSGQAMFIMLLIGPQTTNIPGVQIIGRRAFAEILDWDLEAFDEAFQEVFSEGLAKANWEARFVFVPKAIQHNLPQSPNVVKSWASTWLRVPDCDLKTEAWHTIFHALTALGKSFADAFKTACPLASDEIEALSKASLEPSRKASSKASGEASQKASLEPLQKPSPKVSRKICRNQEAVISKQEKEEEPPKEKSPPAPPESPEPPKSPPDGGSADAHSDFLGVGSLPTEPEPEPPTAAKARTGATGAEAVELPEWLPPEAWERFVRMRRAMGRSAPFTPDAQRLLIKRLASMHDQGEDVVAALDQSTENGWRGVFPVKTAAAPKPPASRHEVNATWGNSGKGGVIEF